MAGMAVSGRFGGAGIGGGGLSGMRSGPGAAPRRSPQSHSLQQQRVASAARGQGSAADGLTSGGREEVIAFLKESGAEHYAAHILRSGFDDMETLQDIEDADLRDLGIPPHHAARLRKNLQELRRQGSCTGLAYDPNNPVVKFLEGIGLEQYVEAMMRGGFDDMDILYDIEDADLADLGVPRGHALKLRKRLREHQLDAYQCAKEFEQRRQPALMLVPTPQVQARPLPKASMRHIQTAALPAAPSESMKSAIELSWEQVQALGTYTVGEMLYRNLFCVMPESVQLFPSHVRAKYSEWSADVNGDDGNVLDSASLRRLFSKFVNAVGCAVAGLHDSTKLVIMLMQLGQRHVNYGVHDAHFEALGKAFAWTLRDILGPTFTKEVEEAWAMAYNFMTSIMRQGLRMAQGSSCMEGTVSTASTAKEVTGPCAADLPKHVEDFRAGGGQTCADELETVPAA